MSWSKITPNAIPARAALPRAPEAQAQRTSLKTFFKNLFSSPRAQPERVAARLASHRDGAAIASRHVNDKLAQAAAAPPRPGARQPGTGTPRNPLQNVFSQRLPTLDFAKLNPFAAPELKGKALVPFAKNAPLQATQPAADASLQGESAALRRILDTAPPKMQSHAGWPNFCQRMENYLAVAGPIQGKDFKALLNLPGLDFNGLLGSLQAYTALDSATATKMSFERDLANMGGLRIMELTAADSGNAELNGCVLGCEQSHLAANPDGKAARPGNQLSLAIDTVLRRADGTVRKVTVMSCSAPALDTGNQPEWKHYVDASGKLMPAPYQKAVDTLKEHVLACAARSTGPRVVLTGIGTSSFLGGLQDESDKEIARGMMAQALAEIAAESSAGGKKVAFYDKDGAFCDRINQITGDAPKVEFLGRLESNWEEDGDLVLNAWDPNSLLGNGLAFDHSGDGFLGRHTLIHFQHAMACALHAERML